MLKRPLGRVTCGLLAKTERADLAGDSMGLYLKPDEFPEPRREGSGYIQETLKTIPGITFLTYSFKPDDFLHGDGFGESGFNQNPLTGLEFNP